MAKDIAIKSVAFNRADPDQLKLLQHAEKRTNFSSYVKRLIQRDMEGGKDLIQNAELINTDDFDFQKMMI